MQIPLGGVGNGLERAYSKNNFIYYWLQYQRTKKSETSWSLYKLIPRFYNFAKIEDFGEKGDPWGDLNTPEATSDGSLIYFYIRNTKIQ